MSTDPLKLALEKCEQLQARVRDLERRDGMILVKCETCSRPIDDRAVAEALACALEGAAALGAGGSGQCAHAVHHAGILAGAYLTANALLAIARNNVNLWARSAGSLEATLERIILQYVPALTRDALEPDKVLCHAQSIRGEVVRALPGRNYP